MLHMRFFGFLLLLLFGFFFFLFVCLFFLEKVKSETDNKEKKERQYFKGSDKKNTQVMTEKLNKSNAKWTEKCWIIVLSNFTQDK